jgi:hypothetical protein
MSRPHAALRLFRAWGRRFDRAADSCDRGRISRDRSVDRINRRDWMLDLVFAALPDGLRPETCRRCRQSWLAPIDRPTASWLGPCAGCGWDDRRNPAYVARGLTINGTPIDVVGPIDLRA